MLSRPEYQPAEPGLVEQAVIEVQRLVGRFLQRIVTADVGDPVAIAALVVVVALAGALIAAMVRSTRRSGARADVAAGASEVGRSPSQWRAEAHAATAAQQWRTALRCWYRLTVAELAAGGLVVERPGATTGEDLASVRRHAPQAGPAFAELTDAFERAWYGQQPVGAADVDAVHGAAEHVIAVAGSRESRRGHRPVGAGSP